MSLTEQIESVQRLGQRFEFGARPGLDAGMLVRWPQHKMRAVGGVAAPERGAERRRYRDASLGVEPVLVRAEELHHAPLIAFPAGRLIASSVMGVHGIAWAFVGVKGNWRRLRIFCVWRSMAWHPTEIPVSFLYQECQTACKPGSVRTRKCGTTIPLGRVLRRASRDQPGRRSGNAPAPCGTAVPIRSCSRWGLPCRPCCQGRGALLPHRFALARGLPCGACAGGVFSVALSLGSPPPAVSRHRIPVEPGLSSAACATAAVRPSGRATNGCGCGTRQARFHQRETTEIARRATERELCHRFAKRVSCRVVGGSPASISVAVVRRPSLSLGRQLPCHQPQQASQSAHGCRRPPHR